MKTDLPKVTRPFLSRIDLIDSISLYIFNTSEFMLESFAGISNNSPAIDPKRFTSFIETYKTPLSGTFTDARVFKRQIEHFAGRAAYAAAVEEILGTVPKIVTDTHGAPSIDGYAHSVSITHSHDYAAAAVCRKDSFVVGIDIEKIKPFSLREGFLRIAFPEENIEELSKLDDQEIYRRWTKKEAFLKILGLGFAENLGEVKILPRSFVYHDREMTPDSNEYILHNHILSAVCCEKNMIADISI